MNKYSVMALLAVTIIATSCNHKTKKTAVRQTTDSVQIKHPLNLLIGTYTNGSSKGIYVYRFDTLTAKAQFKSLAQVAHPSYLAISKNEKFVYSVTETKDTNAAVNAFAFDKQAGKLTFLNSQKTHGTEPCYLSVDAPNKHVVSANYSGSNISVFNVNDNGSIDPATQVILFKGKGIDKERQDKPYLHCVRFSPDGRFLFADDLGTDHIYTFVLNQKVDGKPFLENSKPAFSVSIKGGSGPRHLTFHPNGKYAYLMTEMAGKVFVFDYNNGHLKQKQVVAADTVNARGGADIHISHDGKFLYASNRLKNDGVAIFSIDPQTGKLTKVGYQNTGLHPRNFIITPNDKYLLVAERDANCIQVFKRNLSTGLLTDCHQPINIDKPVCLKFATIQ